MHLTIKNEGDIAVKGIAQDERVRAELNLFKILAASEADRGRGRIAPAEGTFEGIRRSLAER